MYAYKYRAQNTNITDSLTHVARARAAYGARDDMVADDLDGEDGVLVALQHLHAADLHVLRRRSDTHRQKQTRRQSQRQRQRQK
jgi:hypothetical protein